MLFAHATSYNFLLFLSLCPVDSSVLSPKPCDVAKPPLRPFLDCGQEFVIFSDVSNMIRLKKNEKSKNQIVIFRHFNISPLQRPRGISQNVSGLYYVRSGSGYKIHICAKLYYLGRAKVFSSVATDFGPSPRSRDVMILCCLHMRQVTIFSFSFHCAL